MLRDMSLDARSWLRREQGSPQRDRVIAKRVAWRFEPLALPPRSIRSVPKEMRQHEGTDCAQTPHVASSGQSRARAAVRAACHSLDLRGRMYSQGESVERSSYSYAPAKCAPSVARSDADAVPAIDSCTLAAQSVRLLSVHGATSCLLCYNAVPAYPVEHGRVSSTKLRQLRELPFTDAIACQTTGPTH